MADDVIDLNSVNWTHGMFLTPEHFLRQEQYHDSQLLWLFRYFSNVFGLIGGGPRLEPSQRGSSAFDPVVDVDDSGDELRITVSQCRGIARGGSLVEIRPDGPQTEAFSKAELEGASDLGVYIFSPPHVKENDNSFDDPVNPQIESSRHQKYEIKLDIRADEADWSLMIARLRRAAAGLSFEKVPGFIPPCALMLSHSELMQGFRQINENVVSLADRYGVLHRAIVDFVSIAEGRGVDTRQDRETLAFVDRMLVALEDCAYWILDPVQPPQEFFKQLNRLIRTSALFLSLSPPTREYFRSLGEIGEVEFVPLLQQEERALENSRVHSIHSDLQNEVKDSVHSLQRLSRLEQALQGKYLDFRISPSLEGINFVFDRTAGDPVLYKTVARPARPQAHGQDLTFVFAPLKLEARETYRLILVGDSSASFSTDDEVTVEIRINPGEGYGREPMFLTSSHQIDGHRNFAFDFRAPDDVLTISDIRVSLRAAQPIRSAILYVRSRLMGGLSSSSGLSYSGQEELSRTRVSTDKGSGKFRADSERETKPTQTPASPSERVETGEGGKTAKTPPRRKRLS